MATVQHVTLGLFDDPEWAGHALAVLKAVGFASEDVALLQPRRGPKQPRVLASVRQHASPRARARPRPRAVSSAGAIAGALIGKGMPERQARFYEAEVRRGNSLLAVRTRGNPDLVESILQRSGAYDVRPGPGRPGA